MRLVAVLLMRQKPPRQRSVPATSSVPILCHPVSISGGHAAHVPETPDQRSVPFLAVHRPVSTLGQTPGQF